MKKLLMLMLLFSSQLFSQTETYIQVYDGYFSEISDVKSPYEELRAVAIFYPRGKNEIILTVNSVTAKYFQISNSEKCKDGLGKDYESIEVIKEDTGRIMMIHVYADKLRLFIDNDYIEFFNW